MIMHHAHVHVKKETVEAEVPGLALIMSLRSIQLPPATFSHTLTEQLPLARRPTTSISQSPALDLESQSCPVKISSSNT